MKDLESPPDWASYSRDMHGAKTEIIVMFAAYMSARSFSVHTIKRRVSSLSSFARFIHPMDLAEAESADIEAWLNTLRAPRTRHAYRSDVHNFYAWAVRRKLVDHNPADDTDPIRVPKGLPRPVPVHVVPMLVRSAPEPLRLALALAAYAGLRRAEIAALMTDDVQLHGDPVLVVRNGKGGKDRVIPLHPELVAMLAQRRRQGPLVPWTADRIGRRASEHMRRCGFDCTIHQLRHSFGTELARALDGNLVAVGGLMGHESPNTTKLYCGWSGGETAAKVARLYAVA
jgi:integrase